MDLLLFTFLAMLCPHAIRGDDEHIPALLLDHNPTDPAACMPKDQLKQVRTWAVVVVVVVTILNLIAGLDEGPMGCTVPPSQPPISFSCSLDSVPDCGTGILEHVRCIGEPQKRDLLNLV